ncbi:MAG: 2Fe-2S iron-sulfur cluster-binding protein [Myxococcota bacterium]
MVEEQSVVEEHSIEEAPPAAEEAPPPEGLVPGAIPPILRALEDGEEGWESDYSTNDAPVRNAHYREKFGTSGEAFLVRVIAEAEDLDITFECEPGEFVLDAADRSGHELPFSCRSGGCLACSAKLLSGHAEMGEQYVLEDEHIEQRFFLLCCSTVSSDAVIRSHQEEWIP